MPVRRQTSDFHASPAPHAGGPRAGGGKPIGRSVAPGWTDIKAGDQEDAGVLMHDDDWSGYSSGSAHMEDFDEDLGGSALSPDALCRQRRCFESLLNLDVAVV
ncbi:unnamed protein product [Gadus morhua 'NCC']